MPLSPGIKLGPYEIVTAIGAGGRGRYTGRPQSEAFAEETELLAYLRGVHLRDFTPEPVMREMRFRDAKWVSPADLQKEMTKNWPALRLAPRKHRPTSQRAAWRTGTY